MKKNIIFILIAVFALSFIFKKDLIHAFRYIRYQVITPEVNKTTTFPEEFNRYLGDKVFIRIFKEEAVLELWTQETKAKEFNLLHTFPICKWSGELGPKKQEGDGQSPEGFYDVTLDRLNPYSSYHLSFNIGFPNEYDQSLGYTGSYLMIHGDCVSIGCYAMGNSNIEIIYSFVEESIRENKQPVPVHIFPFRMKEGKLQRYQEHDAYEFWQNLKTGYDLFEETTIPPQVDVCGDEYCFIK